jgi:hypothetical protein
VESAPRGAASAALLMVDYLFTVSAAAYT